MKIQTLFLSALSLATIASTAKAQLEKPFSTVNDYTLIVGGDATFNGTHIEGSGFIGGNLENANETIVGNRSSLENGLTVIGNVSGSGTIKSYKDIFIGGSNSGVGLQFENSAGTTATNPFGSTNPFDLMSSASDQLGLESNSGVTENWDSNNPNLTLTTGTINFLSVAPSIIAGLQSGANLTFNGLDSDTYLVLNIDQGSSTFQFNGLKVQGLGGIGGLGANIFWNFLGTGNILFDSDNFESNLIAPDAAVTVQAQSTYGQVVAGSLTDLAGGGWENRPYANWAAPVPETSTIAMLALSGLAAFASIRRRSKRS